LVQEAFINGVSTQRIESLAQALRVENISTSQEFLGPLQFEKSSVT
jgi:hypothetical protein